MKNYKQFFKGKKITVMGLGLLGRGVGYTKFLAECGADLIVTDLKTKEQLKASVEAIKNYELRIKNKNSKKIKFVLGGHRLKDFKNRDMIIKSAGVPLDSIYIKKAKKNKIPVEMDVSLFAKCAPEVMIIGVTGTRGKSMTTTLIYEILKANEKHLKVKVFLGGNLRGVATLPLLKKVASSATRRGGRVKAGLPVQAGDILVCELDSWQLQGFGDAKISPHISVFTTFMPDHMNYYKNSMKRYFYDKANIFKYQKKNDVLIIRPGMKEFIKKENVKSKLVVINTKSVKNWKFNVPGIHHRENMACAVKVAEVLGVPMEVIKKSIENFKGLEGRLQLLKIYKGIKIYNDNNATTPEATIAGIEALATSSRQGLAKLRKSDFLKSSARQGLAEKSGSPTSRNLILICGGADKGLNLDNFVKTVNEYCKAAIFLEGSGTEKLLSSKQKVVGSKVKTIKEAVKNSLGLASRGDIILFSPAFASFGMFNNEYERNDEFMKIIKNLK